MLRTVPNVAHRPQAVLRNPFRVQSHSFSVPTPNEVCGGAQAFKPRMDANTREYRLSLLRNWHVIGRLNPRKFKVATRRQASWPALVPRWLKHITTMRCIESSCSSFTQHERFTAAHRLQMSAIRQFYLVTMSLTFIRWRCTTPASISTGMIAPVKIQVTSIRPLDKL